MSRKVWTRVVYFGLVSAIMLIIASCMTTGGVSGVVGTWHWFTGETVTISPAYTLTAMNGSDVSNEGVWTVVSAADRTIKLTWKNGYIDTLTLSADGKTLSGTNQDGTQVTGTK